MPSVSVSTYSPLKGASVPFWRVTRYCSGVSSCFHSFSDFLIFSAMSFRFGTSGKVPALKMIKRQGSNPAVQFCQWAYKLVELLAPVNGFFQLDAGSELCHFTRCNLNRCAGLRIPAITRLALCYGKCSKAHQSYALTLFQCAGDRRDAGFN